MMHRARRATQRLALVAGAMFLIACELGTSGASGNLQFRDLTPTVPVDVVGRIDQPLAVGAALALEVKRGSATGGDADVVAATSSDPDVFEVESFSSGRVVLRGVAPGRAFLDVTTRDGLDDSIGLAVDAINRSEVVLLPWDPIIQLPESLWADGAVILPESPVDVFGRNRNGEGTVLTGYGAAQLLLSDGAAATLTPRAGSDFATVRSGSALESFTVSTTAGGELTLETVEETAVDRIALYNYTERTGPFDDGETVQVDADSSLLFHLVAYMADGRYVIGSGTEPFVATVDASDSVFFRVTEAPSGSDEGLDRALANGRAFFAESGLSGSTDLTLEWVGLQITLTVQVVDR